MYLTSFYDMDFTASKIYLNNFSNKNSKFTITFYDKKGQKIHETKQSEISSHGSLIIELSEIPQIRKQNGLFIIKCDMGMRGEIFHKEHGAGTKSTSILIQGLPPFSTEGITIFISYRMNEENKEIYELISKFLKLLGFSVLSAKESGRSDLPPGMQIKDMIKECDALLAILTRDIPEKSENGIIYHPSQNVIEEIGQASDKTKLILAQDGVNVGSNIQTTSTYTTFSIDKKEEMLLNLLMNLKNLVLL